MWRTPMTLDGPPRRRPERRAGHAVPLVMAGLVAPGDLVLALETSCDDTCAAVVTARGRSARTSSPPRRSTTRYGGVVPEVASRHHLDLVNAVVDDALRRAGASARRRRAGRGDPGPGPGRRAARRPGHGQGAGRRARAAVRAGRPPAGPRRRELPRPGRARAAVRLPGRQRRPHASSRGWTTTRLHGPRRDARRRGGRGLRQGRAAARAAAIPGGPHLERLAARRRPGGVRVPDRRAGPGPRLLVLRREDRAAVRDPRPRPRGDDRARRADLAASYQHAIVEALAQRVERALAQTGLDRLAIGGGVAANGPLRERLAGVAAARRSPAAASCAPTTRR